MPSKTSVANLAIRATDQTARAFRSVQNRIRNFRASTLAVGASITTAFAALTSGRLFGGFLRSSIELEAQIDRVRAVIGGSADEFGIVQAKIEELGNTTKFTAGEVAAAAEVLAKAGQSGQQIAESLGAVVNASIVSNDSLSDSANLLTTALAAFNLPASESAVVLDKLVKVSTSAKVELREIGHAIGVAGSSAQLAGVDILELTRFFAALRDQGISTERASTGIARALEQIADPASDARSELALLGDTSGRFRTALNTIIAAGPRAEGFFAALTVEARTAFRTLTQNGGAALAKVTAGSKDFDGAAAAAAKTIGGNFAGAVKGLVSAVDAAIRRLSSPLLKPFEKQIRDATAALQKLTQEGSLDAFGKGILDAFTSVANSVRAFLAEFDFRQASRDAGEFVKDAVANFKTFSKVVGTSALTLSTGISVITTAFTAARKFFNFVTEDSEEYKRVSAQLDVQLASLRDKSTRLNQALFGTSEASETAASSAENLASGLDAASAAAQNLSDPTQLDALNNGLTVAQNNALLLARAITDPLERYQTLVQTTGATQEEITAALAATVEVTQQVNEELAKTPPVLEDTATEAAKFAGIFEQLGVESSFQIIEQLDRAKAGFTQLRAAGVFTATDLQRAFLAYAKRVQAALEKLPPEQRKLQLEAVKAAAATVGLADKFNDVSANAGDATASAEALRKAIESVGDAGNKIEFGNIAEPLEDAADAADDLADSIDDAEEKTSLLTKASERLTKFVEEGQREFNEFNESIDQFGFKTDDIGRRIQAVGPEFVRQWDDVRAATEDLQNSLESNNEGLSIFLQRARAAAAGASQLGSNQLAPLRNAITDAENRLAALQDRLESIRDRIDQETAERQGRGEENRIQNDLERRLEELEALRAGGADAAEVNALVQAAQANANAALAALAAQRAEDNASSRAAANDDERGGSRVDRTREIEQERELTAEIERRDGLQATAAAKRITEAEDLRRELENINSVAGRFRSLKLIDLNGDADSELGRFARDSIRTYETETGDFA